MFLAAALAVFALFLGLAAGPASAGPEAGARVPPGKSGDPGPGPGKASAAKKKTGEDAKPASAAGPAEHASKPQHGGNGPSGHHGSRTDKTKVKSVSHDKHEDNDVSPAGGPHQDQPATDSQPIPVSSAPTTTPPRNPDRNVRTLSSGTARITTILASEPAEPAGSAVTAGPRASAPSPPDTVVGAALDPPLLGAGPPSPLWAPFVPALDEPAFPAILLAALALFLAVFGRGDRRDPKLVEAVVDDRAQDVDFS